MTQKIKTLQLIHIALCSGVTLAYLLTGAFSLALFQNQTVDNAMLVLLAVSVAAVVVSNLLFRQQLKKADPKATPEDNMAVYQSASLVRWAILEGAAFLVLFNWPGYMVLGFLLIGYMLYLRPTEARVLRDLQQG